MMAGKTNPNDYEGGHDPELTGSEDRPMTRREHFDKGADPAEEIIRKMQLFERPFWGDDPFAGIPGSHGEHDKPF